jgi:membrane protein required for colicin V production
MTLFSHLQFNWLDIVMGGLVLLALFRSLWTGFSRSVASLLGLVMGFWVAIHHFNGLALRLSHWLHDPLWRSLVAFCLLFFLVYLAFLVAGILAHGLLKVMKLGWIDRLLGAAVGLAKGLVLAGVLLFLLTLLLPTNSPTLRESFLYPQFSRVAQALGTLVPADLRGRFMWKWRRVGPCQNTDNGQEV